MTRGEQKLSDERLLKEYEKGKTLKEIAREHNYSEKSIYSLSRRLSKIKPYKYRKRVKLSKNSKGFSRVVSISSALLRKAGLDPKEELYARREARSGVIILEISEEEREGYVKLSRQGRVTRDVSITPELLREAGVNPFGELYAKRWAREGKIILEVEEEEMGGEEEHQRSGKKRGKEGERVKEESEEKGKDREAELELVRDPVRSYIEERVKGE